MMLFGICLAGEGRGFMLQALVAKTSQLLSDLRRSWHRPPLSRIEKREPSPLAVNFLPLQRVLMTDGVGRTLFEEYAAHRAQVNGDEETGWVLLGLREAREAVVLATLPAGAEVDAGFAHIRFNSSGQAMASRIVRQRDKRLTILGVVHTHPGSLRHPSDGDFLGDSQWVRNLRGQEGIFGIGTADGPPPNGALFAYQPRPNVQALGELRFSWYTLRQGEAAYRPLPVEWTIGPDLARSLHTIWPTLELHADRVDRLFRQQAGMRFEVLCDEEPGLVLTLPLAANGEAVRVVLRHKSVRYYLQRNGEVLEVDLTDDWVDRGVYLLLAELAGSV
jgi:proteasome lid subunit RPN8/RPN11